jgi:ribosomal protein S18 acetylase RimI-like enzyme
LSRITNLTRVRAILESDRPWAAYALGDLSPGLVEHAEWFATDDDSALLLLYRGFDPPVLFTLGQPDRVDQLLDEIEAPALSLQVRPEILSPMSALSTRFVQHWVRPMWRMTMMPDHYRPVDAADVTPLGVEDLDAVVSLFTDGAADGEAPHFFFPSMLRQGIFRGIWEGSALVAAAGTHMVVPMCGVCAIGNVYVRRDRRRRGLAARVTSAVVAAALEGALPTIVLNVSEDNDAAARVYAALGFRRYCSFVEGVLHVA